jgi:hypothetical protein
MEKRVRFRGDAPPPPPTKRQKYDWHHRRERIVNAARPRDGAEPSRSANVVGSKAKFGRLWKLIKESKDKLFIIAMDRPNYDLREWHIVQVNLSETNEEDARRYGKYHVNFWIRSYNDSIKRKMRDCRYWPNIHEYKDDGKTMGPIVPIRPSKVNAVLWGQPNRYMWYQDTINLDRSRVVGPFDFGRDHTIPDHAWKALKAQANSRKIYVKNLDLIVGLGNRDKEDQNKDGHALCYMHHRWTWDD